MNKMKILTMSVVCLSSLALAALAAHFVFAKATFDGTNVTVSFKEAGLGNAESTDVVLSADVTATFGCINGGGKNPRAANKRVTQQIVYDAGTFTSDKNGNITGSLTVSPPDAPEDWSCPPGQTPVLAAVTYSGFELEDVDNGVAIEVPGTFSKTYYTFR